MDHLRTALRLCLGVLARAVCYLESCHLGDSIVLLGDMKTYMGVLSSVVHWSRGAPSEQMTARALIRCLGREL